MGLKLYQESDIAAIADAIRAKTGGSDTYKASEMAQAIADIQTGVDPGTVYAGLVNNGSQSSPLGTIDLSAVDMTDARQYALSHTGYSKIIYSKIGQALAVPDYFARACPCLAEVDLSGPVTEIGRSAFASCAALASILLPAGLTTIGNTAFGMCSALRLTALPAGLTTIGNNAFGSCSALRLTALPAGLTTIGDSAFTLSGVAISDIPASVQSVGASAFANCPNLPSSIKIRAKSIGAKAFRSARNLSRIWISADCTEIAAASASDAPFFDSMQQHVIYCEAASQPAGWGAYWAAAYSGINYTVHWGVSESDFDAIVAGS